MSSPAPSTPFAQGPKSFNVQDRVWYAKAFYRRAAVVVRKDTSIDPPCYVIRRLDDEFDDAGQTYTDTEARFLEPRAEGAGEKPAHPPVLSRTSWSTSEMSHQPQHRTATSDVVMSQGQEDQIKAGPDKLLAQVRIASQALQTGQALTRAQAQAPATQAQPVSGSAHQRSATLSRFPCAATPGASMPQVVQSIHPLQWQFFRQLAISLGYDGLPEEPPCLAHPTVSQQQRNLVGDFKTEANRINKWLMRDPRAPKPAVPDIHFDHVIGQGSSCRVWEAIWRDKIVAVKVGITSAADTLGDGTSPMLIKEMAALATKTLTRWVHVYKTSIELHSVLINGDVTYYTSAEDRAKVDAAVADPAVQVLPHAFETHLVMDLAPYDLCGAMKVEGYLYRKPNMFERARGITPQPNWLAILNVLVSVALALIELLEAKLLMGDLKPENILLMPGAEQGVAGLQPIVKMCDLGFAQQIVAATGAAAPTDSVFGTPCYSAPNLKPREAYTQKDDVWCLGPIMRCTARGYVVTCALANLSSFDRKLEEQEAAVRHPPGWHSATPSPGYRALADDCMKADPAERPDWYAVLERLKALQAIELQKSKQQA